MDKYNTNKQEYDQYNEQIKKDIPKYFEKTKDGSRWGEGKNSSRISTHEVGAFVVSLIEHRDGYTEDDGAEEIVSHIDIRHRLSYLDGEKLYFKRRYYHSLDGKTRTTKWFDEAGNLTATETTTISKPGDECI